ncbi:MAG: DUF6790 family protein [Vulcanimicrobiaceae bacterium]|jgi:hypothetical protein
MPIAHVVSTILNNFGILTFAVAVVVAIAKSRRASRQHVVVTTAYVLWGEILFYSVGLTLAWAGISHAFFQPIAAASTGWKPSPFESELAWAEFGTALVAMASLWRGYEMRLAATLVFAVFSAGAAVAHLDRIARLGIWFDYVLLPVAVLVLAFLSRDAYERTRR